jgi:ribonuclease HI
MKVYIDGSGTPMPNQDAWICWCIVENIQLNQSDITTYWKEPIGFKTNNEAEYLALIDALEDEKVHDCEILSDSQLIVSQIKGVYNCKDEKLLPLLITARRKLIEKKCIINWIPRGQNRAGILLETKK